MNTAMNRIQSVIRLMPLILALTSGGLTQAAAGEIYVITHADTKLTAESIRDIYIGEKQFADSVKLVPLDNAGGQADFLGKVLKLDATRYANLWVKKSFRDALNPPSVKNSDKEIIDLVRKTPGAISYVTTAPPAGVVVLQKY
jgi:hypothetical protein